METLGCSEALFPPPFCSLPSHGNHDAGVPGACHPTCHRACLQCSQAWQPQDRCVGEHATPHLPSGAMPELRGVVSIASACAAAAVGCGSAPPACCCWAAAGLPSEPPSSCSEGTSAAEHGKCSKVVFSTTASYTCQPSALPLFNAGAEADRCTALHGEQVVGDTAVKLTMQKRSPGIKQVCNTARCSSMNEALHLTCQKRKGCKCMRGTPDRWMLSGVQCTNGA